MEGFEFTFDPLQAFQDFIFSLLQPFVDFILGFLPNGDPAIYAMIDGFSGIGGSLTFNIFWFVDWGLVGSCLGILVSLVITSHVIKFVMKAIKLASTAVEAVPIVE